jgi:hypothetical protein
LHFFLRIKISVVGKFSNIVGVALPPAAPIAEFDTHPSLKWPQNTNTKQGRQNFINKTVCVAVSNVSKLAVKDFELLLPCLMSKRFKFKIIRGRV